MDDGAKTLEQEIHETVRSAMLEMGSFRGGPDQLAAQLLSCSGLYRGHPRTPGVVRRIGWMLTGQAAPDFRAKLSLAVLRLAEDPLGAGLSFVDDLRLWATRPGPRGSVGVTHTATDRVVAQYDYAAAPLAINSDLAADGSGFPPHSIDDAVSLVTVYLEELGIAGGAAQVTR